MNSRPAALYLSYVATISGISFTQVVQDVAQKLIITTLPRKSCDVIFCPCRPTKVTSGIVSFFVTARYPATTSAATTNASSILNQLREARESDMVEIRVGKQMRPIIVRSAEGILP